MGTAPNDRQSLVMPDPGRTLRRSVALLRRLGMSKADSLALVAEVGRKVRFRLYVNDASQGQWLTQLITMAEAEADSLANTPHHTEGDTNANR